jgi:hypothetical protein
MKSMFPSMAKALCLALCSTLLATADEVIEEAVRDVCSWHETDMTTALRNVCFRGRSGKHLLVVSISGSDPKRTMLDADAAHSRRPLNGKIEQRGNSASPGLTGRPRWDHI